MKDVDSRLVGVLGTLIFHLVAAIIFMSFKLQSITPVSSDQFTVEFIPEEVAPPEEDSQKELPSSIEQILAGDENMLNLARNLANNGDVNIDPREYIDMVKEEMIENGMLDENNFIDALNADQNNEVNNITADLTNNEPRESQIMEANYQGPTRIYYDLEGRNHTYLPIPIYKCKGSGKIALSIEVSQQGEVTNARIISSESTTKDQCLVETAIETAMISRFNPDINAPKNQAGTLTYLFVAQ